MAKTNKERIDGSGLFFWNTQLSDKEKIEVLDWYEKLDDQSKKHITTLRNEASEEAEYFSQD